MIKFFSVIGFAILLMLPMALIDRLYDIDYEKKTSGLYTILVVYSFLISILVMYFIA